MSDKKSAPHLAPAIRGAELALAEAVGKLHRCFHPCGANDGQRGDKPDGRALAERVRLHINGMESALTYWQSALDHYERAKKGAPR